MKAKMLTTDNAKLAFNGVVAAVFIYSLYKLSKVLKAGYDAANVAVDAVVDPVANAFFGSELYQGESVELTEFDVSRLYRDYFTSNWIMKTEQFNVISKAYPNELTVLLGSNNELLPQYRSQVKEG